MVVRSSIGLRTVQAILTGLCCTWSSSTSRLHTARPMFSTSRNSSRGGSGNSLDAGGVAGSEPASVGSPSSCLRASCHKRTARSLAMRQAHSKQECFKAPDCCCVCWGRFDKTQTLFTKDCHLACALGAQTEQKSDLLISGCSRASWWWREQKPCIARKSTDVVTVHCWGRAREKLNPAQTRHWPKRMAHSLNFREAQRRYASLCGAHCLQAKPHACYGHNILAACSQPK